MLALLSGLLAGGIHVLSGPDHLAAVLPLSMRSPNQGKTLGAVWGLGHGGSMLLWLLAALLFRGALPLVVISEWAELLVGIALLAVGTMGVQREFRARRRRHHASTDDALRGHPVSAALGFGMLHGSAGAGHLAVTLPLLGLSVEGAVTYCLGFTLAGVFSMAWAGAFMGRVGSRPKLALSLRPLCAVITLAVGCFWIVDALVH